MSLPPKLADRPHNDWPWLLKWVPRKWTSFNWGVPVLIFGSQRLVRVDAKSGVQGPSPIGEPDSWQLSYYPNAPFKAYAASLTFLLGSLLLLCLFGFGSILAYVYLALTVLLFPGYFALTTLRGRHFRFGARWDDVDSYVTWLSVAIKNGVTGFGDREPGPYPTMSQFSQDEMIPWKGTWFKAGRVYPWGILLVPCTPTANRAKRLMELREQVIERIAHDKKKALKAQKAQRPVGPAVTGAKP